MAYLVCRYVLRPASKRHTDRMERIPMDRFPHSASNPNFDVSTYHPYLDWIYRDIESVGLLSFMFSKPELNRNPF